MTGQGAPTAIDLRWMQRALELAARGLGQVEPNPMVGAVVADGDKLIAEGWHQRYGGHHAEVTALDAAGDRARGATLYVTLEPCCHHGKTPPCSDRVIRSGLRRVVAAMCDPFGQVCGRGIEQLRAAGIEVLLGAMEREARLLNQPFIKRVTTQRAYVTAKWAMTLDGRLASSSGDSRWISGPLSRRWVHSLRSRMDAIIVGSGTARADDPLLTVRLEESAADEPAPADGASAPPPAAIDYGRRPTRIVIDPQLSLSPQSRLVKSARQVPLLIVTSAIPPAGVDPVIRAAAEQRLIAAGAEILPLADASGPPSAGETPAPASHVARPPSAGGTPVPWSGQRQGHDYHSGAVNRLSIDALLRVLSERGMTNVLVEGGRHTLEAFFAAEAVDALAVFVAPKLIGGNPCHVAPGPCGLTQMAAALHLSRRSCTAIGDDVLIQGLLREY